MYDVAALSGVGACFAGWKCHGGGGFFVRYGGRCVGIPVGRGGGYRAAAFAACPGGGGRGEDRAGLQELDDAFQLVAIRARAAYKSQLAFVQAVLAAGGEAAGEDAGNKASPELEAAARALIQKEYTQSFASFLSVTGWGRGEMDGGLPPLPPLLGRLAETPGCMAEVNGHAELACQWALAHWEQTRAVIGECLQNGSSLLFPHDGVPDEGQTEELLALFRQAEADWRLWMEAVGHAVSPCPFFRGTGTPWTVNMVQVFLLAAHGDYLTGLLALRQEGES